MCGQEVMTLREVSEFLRIGTTTIYTLAKNKKIPTRKIGREWRFLKSEILEWMKEEHQQDNNIDNKLSLELSNDCE